MSPEPRRCPACGGASLRRAFARGGYHFVECGACDLMFYEGAERVERTDHLYPPEYFTEGGAGYPDYVADEAVHRRQARSYLARLGRLGVSARGGDRLVDAGCAAGFFLHEAAAQGWRGAGWDVSAYAVSHARDALGQDVVRAGFLDAPREASSVDLLTMFGVLEHLPRPRRVADRAFELLRPGGVLAVETWNRRALAARALGARWHVYDAPRCLWYHSARSLRALFGDERWELVHYGGATKWISLRHGLAALAFAAPPLARVAREALGAPRLASLAVPYALGDMVFAVLRRRR